MNLIIQFLLLLLAKGLDSKRNMFNIFWNTTNPMFRIDNNDNIIDINDGNLPWEYDQANIICPSYPVGTREADIERYIIYSVDRIGFEDCRVGPEDAKVIAVCDSPHKVRYFTITFRSFTPTPGGLEFKPGETYYFISTSSRYDLNRRVGGRCSSHNMRMQFNVAPVDYESDPNNLDSTYKVNMPRRPTLDDDFSYPVEQDFSDIDSNSVEHRKRSHDHPDEVVKQASVMGPAASGSNRFEPMTAVFVSAVFFALSAIRTLTTSSH